MTMTMTNPVSFLLSIVWLMGTALFCRGVEKDPGPTLAETHFLKDEPDADGLFTALFYVPPDFISSDDSNPALRRKQTTAKDVLEKNGIKFGANATAVFFPASSILVVHNTKEELEKCAVYLGQIGGRAPQTLRMRWRVVEVSEAAWLELTSSQPDKLPRSLSADDLKKLKSDPAWKSCALLECETRSGQRVNIQSGSEMQLVTGFKMEGEHLVPEIEKQKTGLVVEVDAVLGLDDKMVDVICSLSFDYAPPEMT